MKDQTPYKATMRERAIDGVAEFTLHMNEFRTTLFDCEDAGDVVGHLSDRPPTPQKPDSTWSRWLTSRKL